MNSKLLFVFVFAVIIRWASYDYILSSLMAPTDSGDYTSIAENIALGQGYSVDGDRPTLHRAPLLPYFLSLLFLISRDHWLVIASGVHILLASSVCLIIYYTAIRIVDDKTIALIASLLFSINPVSIFWSGFILTEPFFLFFFTLSILYLLKSVDERQTMDFAICGALMGLAALTRPVILGVMPFLLLWVLLFKNQLLKKIKVGFGVAAALFVVTVLPWTVRNFFVSGKLIPITSEGYSNLIGGFTEDPYTREKVQLYTEEERESKQFLNEWKERLIPYILNNSSGIARLMMRKFQYFWAVFPGIQKDELRSNPTIKVLTILWGLYHVTIYVFAIGGFFSIKDKTNVMLFIFIIISFSLMHTSFFVVEPEMRYRLPLEPYLTMLSALGLFSFWKRARHFPHRKEF